MNARRALILGIVAIIALGAAGCSGTSPDSRFTFTSATTLGKTIPVASRKPAGPVTGNLLSGGTITLSHDIGEVTVVNFWATWCPPCVAETPQFDSVYRIYKPRGVAFLGIDTKDSPSSHAKSFVRANNISYPIVYDEQSRTALELGNLPVNLPFTVLVDKHGRVAGVYLGAMTAKDLEPMLDGLLAEG